jgi:hypothetical protein
MQSREDQQNNTDITPSETRTHEMPPPCSKAKSLSEPDAIGKAGLQLDGRETKGR